MSNEDVVNFLKKIKKESYERLINNPFWSVEHHEEVCNMLDIAIGAVEKESCEDAISRETVKTKYKRRLESSLKDESRGIDFSHFADCTRFNEFIDSIPPVNPQSCVESEVKE